MPIKPENRHRYPPNWHQIRAAILDRAKDRCERCGVPNHCHVQRPPGCHWTKARPEDEGAVWIVLTVAHLDHQPENNDPANLLALCQKCHLRHDAPHHRANARRTRLQKSRQLEMSL